MVRERRRRDADPSFERYQELVVLCRDSRTGNIAAAIPGLGPSAGATGRANDPAADSRRQKSVLGSVPAPKLVFPALAPRLFICPGGACARGGGGSGWS